MSNQIEPIEVIIKRLYARALVTDAMNRWAIASNHYLHHIQAPLVDGLSTDYSWYLRH